MSDTAERPGDGAHVPTGDEPSFDSARAAPVGLVETDAAGNLSWVNQRWRDITGFTGPLPVTVGDIGRMLVPEERARVAELFVAAVANGEEYEVDTRIGHPDGTTRRVRLQGTPVLDDRGGLRGFVGTLTDLTELFDSITAHRAGEERYRRLIDEAPVGQVVSTLDGSLVEVNQAFVQMMGCSRLEVMSRNRYRDLLHGDDQPAFRLQVARLLEGEIDSFEMERRLRRADGTLVWVRGGSSLVREGDETLLQSILQDVTEQKLAELGLRESEHRLRDVIEALHEALMVNGLTGIEVTNRALTELFRTPLDRLGEYGTFVAMDPVALDGTPLVFENRPTIRAIRSRRPVLNQVVGFNVPGAGLRWVSVNAVPRMADGEVIGAVTTFTDVTESKLATDALRESEELFRALAESLPVGVYRTDVDGVLVYVNPRWSEITGIPEDQAIGFEPIGLMHPDDTSAVIDSFAQIRDHGGTYESDYRIITARGGMLWLRTHGAPIIDPETQSVTGYIGSIEDITPLVEAQEETNRLAGIVETASDLIGIIDVQTGLLSYLNRAARELFGCVDTPIEQIDHWGLYTPDAHETLLHLVDPAMDRGEPWSGELPMRASDGSTIQVWQTITAKRDSEGRIVQLSAMGRDVTERRRLEAQLAFQATHDPLTGLPNRLLLIDHLEMALARAERDRKLVALLFLDVDRFKAVNDSLGHDCGDDFLRQIATRITEVLRPTDTVARLGGDEFVVLAEDVDDEHHALAVAQRVTHSIESRSFRLGEVDVMATASGGIAVSAGGSQAHAEMLLRDADAAMYRAKDKGRARLELFDESMRRRATQRLELADQLARGIEFGQIEVHYQPGIDLITGRVTSVEALARWRHPERGTLTPNEFISLAEETGLIVGLGLRVLTDACDQGRAWEELLGELAPRIHVNLSARQLGSGDLPALVRAALDRSGLSPKKLCLEITESTLMEDASAVIDRLRELKQVGVSLAIDDFGTGYSSLSYLRRFPVDILKVDRSFVDGLGPDPEDSAIVAAIVSLAATLELEAVAEGVETTEQLSRLRELGCHGAQGFLFARPHLPEEITPLLTTTFEV